jgi:hypothetical protein
VKAINSKWPAAPRATVFWHGNKFFVRGRLGERIRVISLREGMTPPQVLIRFLESGIASRKAVAP